MLIIPIQSIDHTNDALVVILDSDSVDRMGKSDPAEVVLKDCGKQLVNPTILICHEHDHKALNKFIHRNDIAGLIKYLQRGFKFRPESGDHDRGPESIMESN